MIDPDPRPTVEAPDDDPYIWLEEREGTAALVWVEAQNRATMQRFANGRYETERDILKRIFDQPERIPVLNRRGGTKLFNPWQDAEHPRGLWRVTTLESVKRDTPVWDVIVELDALAAEEGEDWVWRGGQTLRGAHDRAILYLSRGGADAMVLREFDLTTRTLSPTAFICLRPEAMLRGLIATRCF